MTATFHSGQREYARIDPLKMLPAPAERPEWVGKHGEAAIRAVGAWRWPLMHKHRGLLVPLIRDAKLAVDFGGLAGPVGYGAVIVDMDGPYRTIDDVPGEPDVFVSSHTLEHLHDPENLLVRMSLHGAAHAHHMPSWHSARHRPENWPHHHSAFCLDGTAAPPNVLRLDKFLSTIGYRIVLAEDDGECLIVVAKWA